MVCCDLWPGCGCGTQSGPHTCEKPYQAGVIPRVPVADRGVRFGPNETVKTPTEVRPPGKDSFREGTMMTQPKSSGRPPGEPPNVGSGGQRPVDEKLAYELGRFDVLRDTRASWFETLKLCNDYCDFLVSIGRWDDWLAWKENKNRSAR